MIENIRRDLKLLAGFREALLLAAKSAPDETEVRNEAYPNGTSERTKNEILSLRIKDLYRKDLAEKADFAEDIRQQVPIIMERLTSTIDAMRPQQDETSSADLYATRQRWDQMSLLLNRVADLKAVVNEVDLRGLAAVREWGAFFLASKRTNLELGERKLAPLRAAVTNVIDDRLREIGTPETIEAVNGARLAEKLSRQIEGWTTFYINAPHVMKPDSMVPTVADEVLEQEYAKRPSSALWDEPGAGVAMTGNV